MAKQRRVRRTAGWIARYVSDDLLGWAATADGRSTRGRTWKDPKTLLKITLLGLLAGCKGPGEVEELSEELSRPVRKLLGIPRRVPDTTLRDFLTKLDAVKLNNLLWVVAYDANRRQALRHRDDIDIPFGVLSKDGKYPSISDTSESEYLQIHHTDGVATHGLVRTVTSCLVTAVGRPVLGAEPIPGVTNEQGWFQKSFGEMVRRYGRLFRLVMYDAGAASKGNADAVIAAGKHYCFLIADPKWQMVQHVAQLLADEPPAFVDEEVVSETKRLVRKVTLMSVHETRKNIVLWRHTRTILRIDNETYEHGELVSMETRYAVSSLEAAELTPHAWLELHVLRWGVETAHGILDTAFEEDARPWIRKNAQGNLAVHLLRRVAYTLMTLYKHVTIRNEDESGRPWRKHMKWVRDMLEWATADNVADLRPRTFTVPPALA